MALDAMFYVRRDAFASVHSPKFPYSNNDVIYRLLDLQTLLMRCAAAGRNGSQVCAPVPPEFASASDGDELKLAQLIFVASECQLDVYRN